MRIFPEDFKFLRIFEQHVEQIEDDVEQILWIMRQKEEEERDTHKNNAKKSPNDWL
jgi:hypothetical protein